MTDTTHLYITDKNGGKHFRTTCSTLYKSSEVHNLTRHLEQAKLHPSHYNFMDIATAKIVEE